MTLPINYAIRPLQAADEAILVEMIFLAIFVPEGGEQPSPEIVHIPELRKYTEDFGRAGDMGLLAVDKQTQEPLGAAWLRLVQGYGFVEDGTPELSMAVVAAARGQGIGTALLTQLIEMARPHYAAISLSVWPENAAYRLYQRLGFELVRSNEGEDVVMVKRLQKT